MLYYFLYQFLYQTYGRGSESYIFKGLNVIQYVTFRTALSAIVFRETTTLGVRYHDEERDVLDREIVTVTTAWGPVPVKVARLGGAVTNAAPEFEACVVLARAHDVPVKDIQAAAMKAWLDRA